MYEFNINNHYNVNRLTVHPAFQLIFAIKHFKFDDYI